MGHIYSTRAWQEAKAIDKWFRAICYLGSAAGTGTAGAAAGTSFAGSPAADHRAAAAEHIPAVGHKAAVAAGRTPADRRVAAAGHSPAVRMAAAAGILGCIPGCRTWLL